MKWQPITSFYTTFNVKCAKPVREETKTKIAKKNNQILNNIRNYTNIQQRWQFSYSGGEVVISRDELNELNYHLFENQIPRG